MDPIRVNRSFNVCKYSDFHNLNVYIIFYRALNYGKVRITKKDIHLHA